MLAPRELLVMEKGPLGNQECTAESMTGLVWVIQSEEEGERGMEAQGIAAAVPRIPSKGTTTSTVPRGGSGTSSKMSTPLKSGRRLLPPPQWLDLPVLPSSGNGWWALRHSTSHIW